MAIAYVQFDRYCIEWIRKRWAWWFGAESRRRRWQRKWKEGAKDNWFGFWWRVFNGVCRLRYWSEVNSPSLFCCLLCIYRHSVHVHCVYVCMRMHNKRIETQWRSYNKNAAIRQQDKLLGFYRSLQLSWEIFKRTVFVNEVNETRLWFSLSYSMCVRVESDGFVSLNTNQTKKFYIRIFRYAMCWTVKLYLPDLATYSLKSSNFEFEWPLVRSNYINRIAKIEGKNDHEHSVEMKFSRNLNRIGNFQLIQRNCLR